MTVSRSPTREVLVCSVCGRRARWWWPGNKYESPKFVCGYHKRTYLHILLWEAK